MRSGLLSVFIFCLAAAAFSADTVIFGGMRLSYSGKGYCVASPYSNGGKWDVWDLKVVDDAALAAKATLTIRPPGERSHQLLREDPQSQRSGPEVS